MAGVERGALRKRAAGAAIRAALLLVASTLAASATSQESVLVLDASRSMWGEVGGKSKYLMVHDAFARALENDERDVPDIGLVSFGSTSPSRCDDVSVQLKPGQGDRKRFLEVLKGVRPWGLTPISDALKQAVQEFSGTGDVKRIIVVADGVENCGGDPCNTALELKTRVPGLSIDVIALRVADDDRSRLSCMASVTGGIFLAAADQSELNDAGTTIIDRVVDAGDASSFTLPTEPPVSEAPAGKQQDEEDAPASALVLNAPLPRANPLSYMRTLARIEPRVKPHAPDADASSSTPRFEEAPARTEPPAPADPTQTDDPDGLAGPGVSPLSADPIQTASVPTSVPHPSKRPSPHPPGDRLAAKTRPGDTAPTPTATRPPDTVDRDAPTARQGVRLRAKLTAGMREIGKPVDWTVYRVENADQALWKQVAAMRAADPTFKLEPGTYLVRARYGYVAASKMIAVKEGRLTDAIFVLNAGGLRVLSHLVFVDAPEGTTARHYVYSGETDVNGMRRLIAQSDTQGEILRLNAGRYRVISRLGAANSVVSTDVEVTPGVLTALEVNHKAAVLSLELQDDEAQPEVPNANIVVFDSDGKLVARIRGATATTLLAPGRYTVSAERDGRKSTRDVVLRIGESKSVRLLLK